MVNQNKIFSFKIKRQAKNIFPRDVERTVIFLRDIERKVFYKLTKSVVDFALNQTWSIFYDYIPVYKIWIQYTDLFNRYRTEFFFVRDVWTYGTYWRTYGQRWYCMHHSPPPPPPPPTPVWKWWGIINPNELSEPRGPENINRIKVKYREIFYGCTAQHLKRVVLWKQEHIK